MFFSTTLFIFLEGIVLETTGTIEEKKQESVQSEPKKAMVSPGQLRIIKRNGSVVDFDGSKIIYICLVALFVC